MKKTLLILSLFCTLSLSGYVNLSVAKQHKEQVILAKLSIEEMAKIDGKGCDWWDLITAIYKTYSCSEQRNTGDCVWLAAKTLECGIGWFRGGGGGGGTGSCTDACPSGGYEDEISTCQQLGGSYYQSNCSNGNPNRVCCIEQ